ncbi:peroxiredoxin [Pyruvatibacter sp.]|uniref:peroxiredoxin n=1 Tax=Pyruvatibacter sp. TaxID=1981328 RepID=UPI003266D031
MTVLVGKTAPDFTAAAVMEDGFIKEDFHLMEHLKGSYGVVFFWPLDFTFVCPSEILAYSNRVEKLAGINTKVVGVSIDSQFTHYAWRNTAPNDGGLGPVKFPMVADVSKQIAREYGVLHQDEVALRGTFLIDKDGIVRHQLVNDLPLGRDADETVRVVEALQFHEEVGEVCPAGWQKGDEGMKDTAEGVADYLGKHAEAL